jgi:hypothetical protein
VGNADGVGVGINGGLWESMAAVGNAVELAIGTMVGFLVGELVGKLCA